MRLTVAQRSADAHDEYSAVLFDDSVFTSLCIEIRILVEEFLSSDEEYILVDRILDLRVTERYLTLCVDDSLDYAPDSILEEFDVAVFSCDDFLPVPLIYEDGVDVVYVVVAADGVHISVDAFAGLIAVTVESHTLPLCEGLNYLCVCLDLLDGELDLTLDAVEVVVDAAVLRYDQRSRNTVQCESKGQRLLECVLYLLYSVLCLAEGKM